MHLCRLFLESYIKNTKNTFVVLGPQETERRRTVNSAATVTQRRRELIAKADSMMLARKRRERPSGSHFWQLPFKDHTKQRVRGPVFETSRVRCPCSPPRNCPWRVHQWIFQTLATTLTFTKREATAEDIIIILTTLWM